VKLLMLQRRRLQWEGPQCPGIELLGAFVRWCRVWAYVDVHVHHQANWMDLARLFLR
jgi:hypothetical protein